MPKSTKKKKVFLASKENAAKALKIMVEYSFENKATNPQDDEKVNAAQQFVVDFIEAAKRKLPSKAAYEAAIAKRAFERRKINREGNPIS